MKRWKIVAILVLAIVLILAFLFWAKSRFFESAKDSRPQPASSEVADMTPSSAVALNAPKSAAAGSQISVSFTGPKARNDLVTIASSGMDADDYVGASSTPASGGSPAKLKVPGKPGEYEIRYFSSAGKSVLATSRITVTAVSATLDAPKSGAAGSEIKIPFTGPNASGDQITIATSEMDADEYSGSASTPAVNGTPAKLTLPGKPGEYEVRYFFGPGKTVLATATITVTAVLATLDAPKSGAAGSEIKVPFTGPSAKGDQITIAKSGMDADDYTGSASTHAGNGTPAKLTLPGEPGEYEVRYFFGPGKTVLATATITVTAVSASLDAPKSGAAGSEIKIPFTGPNARGDQITIAKSGMDADDYTGSASTQAGNGTPAKLTLPGDPGEYEVRYFFGPGKTVLAAATITVTAVSATLDAPKSGAAGSEIKIPFTGPNARGDQITIARSGMDADDYARSSATHNGTPAKLKLPEEPGEYEVRYFFSAAKSVLARAVIKVGPKNP